VTGLQVPGDVGIPQTTASQINSVWDTYDAVVQWLNSMGISHKQRPPFPFPELTEDDYVHIEGDDYSRLMLRVDKWFEYAEDLQAQFKGRLLAVKDEMTIISVDYRQQVRQACAASKTKKPPAEEMKDNIMCIPRYRELMLYEQNLTMSLETINAKLSSLGRFAKGLSRQITLRGQEIDLGGKAGRSVSARR
jgi:hypothetical protein